MSMSFTRTTIKFTCDYCGGAAESTDLSYVKQVAANHLHCKRGFIEQTKLFDWYYDRYDKEVI